LNDQRANYYQEWNQNYQKKVFFGKVIHNSKRGLQKAVDQVLYGSTRTQNEAKSLLQDLSGKDGVLRRYSLGKRQDYSARSVIIPNPNLLLDQVALPIQIALVLYEPFIIRHLLKEKTVFTVKEAQQLLIKKDPIIFPLLEEIIANHPLLVNRAPTLHRLSIQGFYPRLTLGKSIELHPLITSALNADFDGDQIAIYLPLTKDACQEIKEYVLSPHHIIDPKNGHLINTPSQDMILGIYYLTKEQKEKTLKVYDEISIIWKKYEQGKMSLHELFIIPARLVGRNFTEAKNQFLITTLGKIIFNQILPASFPYYLNDLQTYNEEREEYQEPVIGINEFETKW
jgi:DNA-directed RNA polymerase subunit beta'